MSLATRPILFCIISYEHSNGVIAGPIMRPAKVLTSVDNFVKHLPNSHSRYRTPLLY